MPRADSRKSGLGVQTGVQNSSLDRLPKKGGRERACKRFGVPPHRLVQWPFFVLVPHFSLSPTQQMNT